MVKRKKLKYSKIKFNAYSSLNKEAQNFIKATGGFTTTKGYLLQGTENLEFIVTEIIQKSSINVQIRYLGCLLGSLQLLNGSEKGYRYKEKEKKCFEDLSQLLNISN